MSDLTHSQVWQDLQQQYWQIKNKPLADYFASDPQRFSRFSIEFDGLLFDFSKNHLSSAALKLLLTLSQERKLSTQIATLFAGEIVNRSEQRAAMHMALRHAEAGPCYVRGIDVTPAVQQSLAQMSKIVSAVRERRFLGFNGEPIDTIVSIGIGGSDLGPQLLLEALAAYVDPGLQYHFFSTHDRWYVLHTLQQLNPATTLCIFASKSFTTEETIVNAGLVKAWQLAAAPNLVAAQRQWIAVTAEQARAIAFDILPEHILPLWDWVGGRYSIWSAVSLIAAIAMGMPAFQQFLAGGYAMDRHFQSAELSCNIPVILALIELWYTQFFGCNSRALLPYGQRLRKFPDYMQQLHMESLGKSVTQAGEAVDYATGNIIWGGVGTNSQHSFHQLLLQGRELVPVDFILALNDSAENDVALLSHCLAQSQVMCQGYHASAMPSPQLSMVTGLLPHQLIPGNVPSTIILLKELSPYHLGILIALYEHKVFAFGAMLDINPFDQWGVERGKQIAQEIRKYLHDSTGSSCYDASMLGILSWIKQYYLNKE